MQGHVMLSKLRKVWKIQVGSQDPPYAVQIWNQETLFLFPKLKEYLSETYFLLKKNLKATDKDVISTMSDKKSNSAYT